MLTRVQIRGAEVHQLLTGPSWGKNEEEGEKLPPRSGRQLAQQKPAGSEGGPGHEPPTLTRVLQGAPAAVVAHAVHTDTPVGTGVLHTVVRIHLTGWSFKAGGTGTPEGREAGGPGPGQQPS